RAEALDQRHASTSAELEAQAATLADAERALGEREAELATARERGDAARARAETAEAALRDTHARLESALRESASVSSTLEAVREELAATTAKLASAGDSADAAALWALEIARSERRWQLSVSPGMDLPSPFEDTDDALRLAVEVE